MLDEKYEEKGQGEDLYGGGRRPGTEWVEGSKLPGSKFYQNRVCGSNEAIMEQVGKQNTTDQLGVSKREIGGSV